MKNTCRVIHTSFAPTVGWRDAGHAASLLARPTTWQRGTARAKLEHALAARLGTPRVLALDSGRNALRMALQALGVRTDDEVLLQAFTCVSVPGPVLWLGARPVYVDIRRETFNMDPEDLRKKITRKTKAIIVQHTFGLPADLDEILAIAKEHDVRVIEDCAHALGSTYHGRPVGTFGHAAIFSFGRDKVISSVFGGALALRNRKLETGNWKLEAPPPWWIARQLLHTALAPTIRSTYYCGGRELLRLALATTLLSKAITHQEKWGGEPPLMPSVLPNALALRALDQLARLDDFLEHRQAVAKHYTESLADLPGLTLPTTPPDRTHGFLRYAMRAPNRDALHAAARRAGIVLRDAWYDMVVAPRGTDLRAVRYELGSCPTSEAAAAEVANLPTSPTMTVPDADRVIRVVRAVVGA